MKIETERDLAEVQCALDAQGDTMACEGQEFLPDRCSAYYRRNGGGSWHLDALLVSGPAVRKDGTLGTRRRYLWFSEQSPMGVAEAPQALQVWAYGAALVTTNS